MHLTSTLTDDAILALRPDVVATAIDDGAILLDLESKYFYALNGSAWSITQLFEAGASIEDARRFARACGAPDDGALASFIDELRRFDLLEPAATRAEDAVPAPTVSAWTTPTVERQDTPLQQVIVSAFDPSVPLAE
jgi:hypothetical protein